MQTHTTHEGHHANLLVVLTGFLLMKVGFDFVSFAGFAFNSRWRQVALAGPDPLAAVVAGGPRRPDRPA